MTNTQLFEYYITSIVVAILAAAAAYTFHPQAPIPGAILGFIAAAAVQTHQSQHKRRP